MAYSYSYWPRDGTNINVPLEERVVDLKLMSERQHRSDQVMLGLGEIRGTCVWVPLAREQVGALKRVPSCPDVDSKDVLAHATMVAAFY